MPPYVDARPLTVGKYPSVKTESRLVFPQAPSPMITSFLRITCWSCCAILPTYRISRIP